ncbi:MAG: mechanosensitive ion channel family protein [Ignavibacteria bacterium]|nr:mechanosensitive ion channel family protein [Ignavibacteria bacterium]MBK7447586.1 mechanosensitive ion channel family protein [Ignavibacteria bacterium]MBK8381973.1 mechanosensitive ion channel family protein [Ignavibacteria bacterium]MBK9406317.1 mechanosensitive ion channel family protein [Ignavibacteria bacterium]
METEFINEVNVFWKEFIHILPKAIIAFVIFILFLFLSGKVSNLVKNRLVFRTKDPLLSGFISKITKWIVSIIGFVICMEILGFATLAGGIVTGAGLSAVILGFAFKNIGENFLSGLLLAFNRPFNTGDLIQVEGYTGKITSMDFRTTNIETFDGQNVFIPNSIIINNPLVNYTYESKRRIDFTIQVDYTNDLDKAKKIILNSIKKVKDVLEEPKPLVIVDELTTSMSIKSFFWIDTKISESSLPEIKSNVIELSRNELNDEGIFITDVTQIKIMNDPVNVVLDTNKK